MANQATDVVTNAAANAAAGPLDHFLSVFFVLGLITVVAYAWQRFNEPTFPTGDALPHTVTPLRYLFLRSAYQKARCAYVAVLLFVYCLLVAPGPSMAEALGQVGLKDFPPAAWALVVALLIAGLLPNTKVKPIIMIEEWLRRLIHESYFVPDGVKKTIGILEDADYEPPEAQLRAVASPLKEQVLSGLKLERDSLGYRWARASMLMQSLRQMGAGGSHPLKKAAFEPFKDDLEEIRARYKALAQDIAALQRAVPRSAAPRGLTDDDKEENLTGAVDNLLMRIYAYVSWGVRYQVDSQKAIDDTLQDLGFRIPELGDRRLFDTVAPAVLLIALITIVFWVTVDTINRAIGAPAPTLYRSILYALTSAAAASFMYGRAVFIALKQREAQIEQKIWRQGAPVRLVPIAVRAGLFTWAVIVVTTVTLRLPDTLASLPGLAHVVKSLSVAAASSAPGTQPWNFLPVRIATAFPWLLAGATVSVLLACALGGDVRRIGMRQRLRDAALVGAGLSLAVAAAQLIQSSLADGLGSDDAAPLGFVPIVGFAGFLCGAVIGFMVPRTSRANLVTPTDPISVRMLRDLLRQAEIRLGSRAAAQDWVFMPHPRLRGISPAEAMQYQAYANEVQLLLDGEEPAVGHGPGAGDRLPSIASAGAPPIAPVHAEPVLRLVREKDMPANRT
jgi:hypothetical protein